MTQPQVAICSENKTKKSQRRVGECVFMCNRGAQTLFFMSECDSHAVFHDTGFSSEMFSFYFEDPV